MQDHPTTTVRNAAKKAETAVVAPPCAMVIFGAGGDLTKRLVTPALYNLVTAKRLPDGFRLVGVDHGERSVEEWRKSLSDMMSDFVKNPGGEFHADHIDQTAWKWLCERITRGFPRMRNTFSAFSAAGLYSVNETGGCSKAGTIPPRKQAHRAGMISEVVSREMIALSPG